MSAAMTIPLFVFQVMASQVEATLLSAAVQFLNALLFMYVLSSLRALLTQKQLTGANNYLAIIIGVTLSMQIVALFAVMLTFLRVFLLPGLIGIGVLYIVTGIKLLNDASRLPGLRFFSVTAIILGTCTASIVLALIALPVSIFMDIALAMIFFREIGREAAEKIAAPAGEQAK